MRRIVLPEALRTVLPSFISIAVGFFQDTSLIVIIGLFDLLNTARSAAQDPNWLGFCTGAFVFVGMIYWSAGAPRCRGMDCGSRGAWHASIQLRACRVCFRAPRQCRSAHRSSVVRIGKNNWITRIRWRGHIIVGTDKPHTQNR